MAADWLEIARSGITFNAPLSEARSDDLVARIQAARPSKILDLGCGRGELLLRALAATPQARGTGVDTDDAELARARLRAAEIGVADRCELVQADAASWQDDADAVIASGASQAFGGYAPMFTALRARLAAGGLAIVGEAVWAAAPTENARNILGELPSPDDVRLAASEAALSIEQAALASQDEWDEFESGFCSALERSDDAELCEIAEQRRREYEHGYRGVAGYVWLVARG